MLSKYHTRIAKDDSISIFIRLPVLMLSSWIFQGILYMDSTEKLLRIFFELYIATIFAILIHGYLSYLSSIFISVILVHTLNWIINGQIPVLLKNLNLLETDMCKFVDYMNYLNHLGNNEKSIKKIIAYGSLSRGELTCSSDLDIRIIRRRGINNALKIYFLLILLRFKSILNKFPLDIYMLDDERIISKHISNEAPVVLYNNYDD